MGWKGTMRSMAAAARRYEKARLRELKVQAREQELAYAREVVREYDAYIKSLTSVHRECSAPMDWHSTSSSPSPEPPERPHHRSTEARRVLERFTPGILDRLLGRVETRRQQLARAVQVAESDEEREFEESMRQHLVEYASWEDLRHLARRVLEGDVQAYGQALESLNPLDNIPVGSGATIGFIDPATAEATLRVLGPEIVPDEVRALLRSGRLQVRRMPVAQGQELYRAHVCSAILRLAQEILAFLPIRTIMVHANSDVLNARTGHVEEQTILSVMIPRATLERLSPKHLDPASALENFLHRISFRKTKGLSPVEPLRWTELQA